MNAARHLTSSPREGFNGSQIRPLKPLKDRMVLVTNLMPFSVGYDGHQKLFPCALKWKKIASDTTMISGCP